MWMFYTAVFFVSREFWFSTATSWRRQRSSMKHRRGSDQLWAPQNTNLVRSAQVLHPWDFSVLQAIFFGTARLFWAVVAFIDAQAAVCYCRQLQVQTLRVTGDVLLRAALAGRSFLTTACRRLTLLHLLAVTSRRLLCSRCICRRTQRLAGPQSCVRVPGPWAHQYGLVGGACNGATPPGQSAVARFFRRSETWPLARSWIIAPVEIRETGFPGAGGQQCASLQGAITEILNERNYST